MKKKHKIALAVVCILVATYFLGPSPAVPNYSNAMPQITSDVATYVQELETQFDIKKQNEAEIGWADSTQKEPTAVALLYLHGYTACKVEGQPVYQDFAKRYGTNYFAARLSEQGINSTEPMKNYTAEKLWESAKQALAIAKKLGQKIIIMSTSTGGTLALKLAAEFPEDVFALVNLSPNIRPKATGASLLNNPWGKQIGQLIFNGNYRVLQNKDKDYKLFWYDKYHINSLIEMQNLVETTMQPTTFKRVHCPSLTLYYFKNKNKQDNVVDVDRITWMHQLLATPATQKKLVALPNAQTHVIGCGKYSKSIAEVEAAIFSFSEQVLHLEPVKLAH